MLSVAKLTAEQASYYEDSVAESREDYYAGRGEARGVAMGRAAAAAGLSGELADGELAELLALRRPRRGEGEPAELRRLGSARRVLATEVDPATGALVSTTKTLAPVSGYDMTFGVPKSLSVLAETADPETAEGRHIISSVNEAHEAAVAAALSYLEDHTCRVRLGRGGALSAPGSGFVAAAYRHRTSRAQDPHLHTHVLVANATQGPDGRWRALDGQAILGGRAGQTGDHRHAASDLYDATLRAEMAARGFRFGALRRGGFGEIAEVPEAVVREFSTRRRQVVEEMAATGQAGYHGSRAAALMTRARKVAGALDLPAARRAWRARAEEHGLSATQIEDVGARALLRLEFGQEIPAPSPEAVIDELVSARGLTETANTFNEARARQAICQAHQQGITPERVEELLDRLLADPRVVEVGEGIYTTTELVERERAILADAQRTAQAGIGLVDERIVDRVLEARAQEGRGLSAEQAAAVRTVASSGRRVEVIEAFAGTGKTHTLGAIADVYRAAGYQVIGAAPTGRAARELAEVAGEARTLDGLAEALGRRGGFEAGRPVVVLNDEAGMNPTRTWAHLLDEARAEGVRVKWIAVGDSGQLQSVAAGGAFRALAQARPPIALTEVRRQRGRAHRAALGALRVGRPAEFVAWKAARGELRTGGLDEMAEASVAEWARAQEDQGWGQVALIARDNALREELNLRARSVALERGWIGGEVVEVGEAERARQFTPGDRIIARRNDRAIDTENGTRGTVAAADPVARTLTVAADDGRRIVYPAEYLDQGLVEHAYALTGHTSQGATLERAPVVGRPSDFTAEWGYVAHSRERVSSPTFLIAEARADAGREDAGGLQTPVASPAETITRYLAALGRSEAEDLAVEAGEGGPADADRRRHLEEAAQEVRERTVRAEAMGEGGPERPNRRRGFRL